MQGRVVVGVGGWNFAPWRGKFYPRGLAHRLELHHASRVLTSIEINSTYYRAQTPQTFRKWRDETPEGFVFAVKAPMFATHRKRLADGAQSVDRFLRGGVTQLGEKLGPLNWQLAPTKRFDAEELDRFLALLPPDAAGVALRHALEVRHPSFDCGEAIAVAKAHGVALVEAGDSAYPRLQARTAPFAYLRLMGSSSDEPRGYATRALARWHERIDHLASLGDVFVYFISGAKERNPFAAQDLIARLQRPASRTARSGSRVANPASRGRPRAKPRSSR